MRRLADVSPRAPADSAALTVWSERKQRWIAWDKWLGSDEWVALCRATPVEPKPEVKPEPIKFGVIKGGRKRK